MVGALIGAYYGEIALDHLVTQDLNNLEGFIEGHMELEKMITEFIKYKQDPNDYTFNKHQFTRSTTVTFPGWIISTKIIFGTLVLFGSILLYLSLPKIKSLLQN